MLPLARVAQIYVHGSDLEQFGEKLPRGFSLRPENDTCAVLCRAKSPPPLEYPDLQDDGRGGMLMFPGEDDEKEADHGIFELPEDANMTLEEYRKQVRKRIAVLGGLADQGDMRACMELGARLLFGNGTRKDPAAG